MVHRKKRPLITQRIIALAIIAGCLGLAPILAGAASPTTNDEAVLLFGIGVHIEPFGAQVSSIALQAGAKPRTLDPRQTDYNKRPDFERHVEDLQNLAAVVELFGGVLTVQAQTAFTTSAIHFENTILSDFEDAGHEIALHFHENVHLGEGDDDLDPAIWTAVMREEIDLIHQAGVEAPINYWSGGNLYPQVLQAAAAAGLSINSDWKNPSLQATPAELMGIHPWRPAGGTDGSDVSAFAAHDADGDIIFLPGGLFDPLAFANKNLIKQQEGLEGWLDVLEDALEQSLAAVRSDRVNVFHFTVHPAEFVGDPLAPYFVFADFLDDVVAPLVDEGKIRWATFSKMAEEFETWEAENPGVDPHS